MSRTAIVLWLLAASFMDSRAAENMSAFVGQNVLLPCPCSEDTEKLVWQIGEEAVVSHCCKETDALHKLYVNRTQVFLSTAKGNCSLLLREVALIDEKNFTCYIFVGEDQNLESMHQVLLKVEENGNQKETHINPSVISKVNEPHKGVSVGLPLSLILVIVAGLVVAHRLRKHQQRNQRMVMIQDSEAKLPIENYNV